MSPKLNVNLASTDELLALQGVGKAKAKVITEFIEKGGTFNSIDEFQNVAKLQPEYLDALKGQLEFEGVITTKPRPPLVFDPIYPIPPIEPIRLQYYHFKVQLQGLERDDQENPYEGYKLIVGYNIYRRRQNKRYSVGADGSVNVKIFAVFRTMISDNFHLVVTSPTNRIIYDSTFDIEHEDEVGIKLTAYENQNLEITLNKKDGVNYENYKLRLKSKIDRGESGIETLVKSYDIASVKTLDIDFEEFGKVLSLNVEVISAQGEVFYSLKKSWDEITENSGLKELKIDLPAPQQKTFNVQLVIDPEELKNPYLDHVAMISYDLKDPQTFEVIRRMEDNYSIDALGKAKVSLRHYGTVANLLLQVKAPGGEIIGKREMELTDVDGNNEIEIKVPPRELAGIDGIETLPERPKKMVGRVLDAEGSKKFVDVQVIIYTTAKSDPQEEDYVPTVITRTEADGYFLVDTPVGYYAKAFAKVGIPKKGNAEGQTFDVPIRLDSDTVVIVKDGEAALEKKLFFPPNLALVVDLDTDEDDDCSGNDCHLDFHKHKQVVDEFSYFTVVRTTEPNIQGYTLEEDGEMTIQDIIDIVPIAPDNDEEETTIPISYRKKSIDRSVLMKYINDKKGLTLTTLKKALFESNARKLRQVIKPQRQIKAHGRYVLNLDNAIDWDEDPTIYQATTLSHGHLLQFKQEWVADGYSMGDLLYSLPLAPGQKKQVVVFDWERRESAARVESLDYQEGLYNSLSRDRDVNEIVTGTLDESMRGGSKARTGSFGGGLGIGGIIGSFGGLLGVAGGSSKASSSAWQNSSRRTAMNDMHSLRDRTVQSANAVRSQRGTVVQTASQGERFSVETEVVANYNHCHSLTIQYFEVLRHLKIQHRLSSVQESLFIPLIMTTFDYQKILRWREILERYVWNRRLRKGFNAIERIENDYEGSDLPLGTYAQENLEYLEGGINILFDIPSPTDLSVLNEKNELSDALSPLKSFFPNIQRHIDRIFEAEAAKRNEIFYKFVAPEIGAAIVEYLTFEAVVESGVDGSESTVLLPLDTTLVTNFRNGRSHYVSIRQDADIDPVSRESIKAIRISKAANTTLSDGKTLFEVLPSNTRVMIKSGVIRYRSSHYSGYLFRKSSIKDDLIGYGGANDDSEYVRIATPLNRRELRNPRNEDLEVANTLQDHLNDNMEYFHKAIWMNMSPERRFMFLDGIQVNDYSEYEKYPLGVVRSVASVVENKVIGIVGNSLVMPVAPGFRLDPNTKGKEIDLVALYQPITPLEPIAVSIPTKGVFAEAVMGKCNSCEEIEENRFWRWSQEPIPDSPTSILPISTETRRATPQETTPTQFPNPVVNIQNAPAAPDPSGLSLASNLLKESTFKDITGLEQNQKNAIEGLKASLNTAQAFGTKAADLASLGAQIDAIDKAKKNGLIDKETAKQQTEKALKNYSAGKVGDIQSQIEQVKRINDAVKKSEISPDVGKKLTDKVVDGPINASKSIIDNAAMAEKIKEGKKLEYQKDGESLKVETEDGPVAKTNLLKFMVNFRRPKTFTWSTGVTVDYKGHFGFDWLRDEYINPMEKILSDLTNAPKNTFDTINTDVSKLKAEYLSGDPSPIKPHGKDYYPGWLAIMPYTTTEEFKYGSQMHKNGVKLSLEIDEIDALANHKNELEFVISSPAKQVLSISPKKFTLDDVMKKGTKRVVDLNKATNLKRTFWHLEDFVTVKCVGGVLTSHAEIKVVAKGSDKEEVVGKLMVYANNRIPKAEIVMVRFSYTGANVKLDSTYHSILKNNSFNQALLRAEVLADEKFTLNDLPATDADVIAFKAAYPTGTSHNADGFMNDLLKLYKKHGKHYPGAGDKRTILFLTDQVATAGGIAEGTSVLGKFVWGNAVVIFNSNLSSESTFVHEIGHSLSLPHVFERSNMPGANAKHRYYRGYTDNVMDYTTRYDGTVAKNTLPNPHERLYFFKWQWDLMRADQSVKDNY